MSQTRVVEFIGGPYDGELREMEAWVGIVSTMHYSPGFARLEAASILVSEGTYVLRWGQKDERPQMIWQGVK